MYSIFTYSFLNYYQQSVDNLTVVCNLQWFFFLFHQSFFMMVPLMMLNHEIQLANIPPGYTYLSQIWRQAQALIMARRNQDRTELV